MARQASPDLLEAHLLEAIALDLNGQHDKSVRRLTYLIDSTKNLPDPRKNLHLNDLCERALLSRAVSKFHKYDLKSAESAISDLKDLISSKSKISNQGLRAHAYALRAAIHAHLPLYPGYERPEVESLGDFETWASKLVEETEKSLSSAEKIIQSDKGGSLGEEVRHELNFSISNARGNIALNIQKSLTYFEDGISKGDAIIIAKIEALKAKYLDDAHKHFRYCEENFPLRIEIVMNIATVLLEQDKLDQAIMYCEKAIGMNPKNEYAHYRKFQIKVKNHGNQPPLEELKEIYNRFKANTGRTEPKIPSFTKLLDKYIDGWRQ